MENTSTPELAEKAVYVLPNLSVIYGFGFLDLRREPVVLSLPDSNGLYYMVETVDMWTNAFAYPAGAEEIIREEKSPMSLLAGTVSCPRVSSALIRRRLG